MGVSKFEQMNLDMVSCGVPGTLDGAVEEYWQKFKFHNLDEFVVAWRAWGVVRLRIRKPSINR